MKRLKWDLNVYQIPHYVFYDSEDRLEKKQVPILKKVTEENPEGTWPPDNTYFIGEPLDKNNAPTGEKLLCYHTNNGKYIVVSYNYSSYKLLENVINSGIFDINMVDTEEE